MKLFSGNPVKEAPPWAGLIAIADLRDAFAKGNSQPLRTAHAIPAPGELDANFLAMPAWKEGGKLAMKILVIAPGNSARNLPAVNASVLVIGAVTGQAEAVFEGAEPTARCASATSALTADLMARKDVKSLLIAGAGMIAGNLEPANLAVRDNDRGQISARRPGRVQKPANQFDADVTVVRDLDAAVAEADVIAAATITKDPPIMGTLMKGGAHLDLVGGFTSDMREADRRAAGGIIVDTHDGDIAEAGDITQPLADGSITRDDMAGDMTESCRGDTRPRRSEQQITVFKSRGAAIKDLAAARMVASS